MNLGHQALWLALMIGNSRWHWGAFAGDSAGLIPQGDRWLGSWHTAPLSESQVQSLRRQHFAPSAWPSIDPLIVLPTALQAWATPWPDFPELWLASVVKAPLPWLADYSALRRVTLDEVPLHNTYPTLGVDRALALVGAGDVWGWPVLVVDCGTALTFTAGVDQRLIGGAILLGLRSQLRALHAHTDQLPNLELDLDQWPQRWATDTAEAIASGILHTQLAGIRDFITAWRTDWPTGAVVLTGGDGAAIYAAITKQTPELDRWINLDPDLGFWGLRVCRQSLPKPL
ncbi:pantothenate kinase [Nodosilinea sp. LEGE 06152]|uniref:pantothenate kinase n=1 Tax=Nodosilinea sp. LEGE 06152 TaxID=2777966 RepID=UPI001880D9EB|nr:pantothenate kinase [Nodosilinea sp. LEGE 06152]MBE9159402.1 pantothenate kinase [Nodosilinea sp. LEGE 06152]